MASSRLRVGACLSLTGRFGRFGRQAAHGLEAWQRLAGERVELCIEDDASDPNGFVAHLRRLAARCEVLLGPYSTQLMRPAATAVADVDGLLWNHGGAGDDVQALCPGRIVSLPSPASRYALPFLGGRGGDAPLWVVHGPGRFGRQIAAGAAAAAARVLDRPAFEAAPARWDLFCAGRFEDDIAIVEAARRARHPPRAIGSVAAGVRDFAEVVPDPDGIYGVAQWFPSAAAPPAIGPSEPAFVAAYGAVPDYPAVQAAAAAALAVHCLELAGTRDPAALFAIAAGLETTTLLGPFAIDPVTGAQTRHTPVLVRWRDGRLSGCTAGRAVGAPRGGDRATG
jgi:branched-chain amino acid transport system substrate-binding protein